MKDWKILLLNGEFRRYWLALVCYDLGTWCVVAILPVLVASRFNAGGALLASLGARVLPRILLAPVAASVLRRGNPAHVLAAAVAGSGALTLTLPWCGAFYSLQGVILTIGVLDVFATPALLVLRTPVTARGLEVASNTLCFSADRMAKVAGPALGGLALLLGPGPAFALFGAAMLLSACVVLRIRLVGEDTSPTRSEPGTGSVLREFRHMMRRDPIVVGLLVCAVPYMVTLGGMRPFLFWANADWLGNSDAAWTLLLSAQGIGAIAGALVSGMFSRALLRVMPAYELMLVASLLEGLLHGALLLVPGEGGMAAVLVLGGIPEMLAYATYFACAQERLSPARQAVFYSMQQPLMDSAFVLGVASASLHSSGFLSLWAWWLVMSLFSTVPLVPLLSAHFRGRRVVPMVQP